MSTKILVTNWSALKSKYGSGVSKIRNAIQSLIVSDKNRGVKTKLIAIDDAKSMKKIRGKPVIKAGNPKENKLAIDAVYSALEPDYIVILGAGDVIPHQNLRNPLFGGDPDRYAFSDLPYACDNPYSLNISAFTGPTRIVGRIPDIAGTDDPSYLVNLLKTASNWQIRQQTAYDKYLGISAAVWQNSTKLSLRNLFGSHSSICLSPPKGYKWSAAQLKARSHFINCHGAMSDASYYGQKGDSYPTAHTASWVTKKLSEGTVASVECCYGAELYDPADIGGQMGICNTYLESGAYGFFGSSTIAYGPPTGNGAADLICQYFLKYLFMGASLGRAVLQARHEFVQSSTELDPIDQKTLAQFNLFGDPSIHPVRSVEPVSMFQHKTALKSAKEEYLLSGRSERRQHLKTIGKSVSSTVSIAVKSLKLKPSTAVEKDLKDILKKAKITMKPSAILSFSIRSPKSKFYTKLKAMKKVRSNAFHVHLSEIKSKKVPSKHFMGLKALIAKEENGKIVSYKEYQSR